MLSITDLLSKSVPQENSAPQSLQETQVLPQAITQPAPSPINANRSFFPKPVKDIAETGVPLPAFESLILKFLFVRGTAWGSEICEQLKLPFSVISNLMRKLKDEQLVGYLNATSISDYNYQLTATGAEHAQRDYKHCTYFGAAPVNYADYLKSVEEQSLDIQTPSVEKLRAALSDLLMPPETFNKVGQAIHSARALFLYGFPGNGKTSIAQRLCQAFGKTIWIPRALTIEDQIVRLFDPAVHTELKPTEGFEYDKRWVLIERPTIIVGGELKLEHLEMTLVEGTGIVEAPLQLKSNCGTLVIDDFGRQQMTTTELLNRWILPLESRCDYLNMPSGKKVRVPFDQMIIFSTNLDPKELVDEAFLRRIPYKIHVPDPTDEQFQQLFSITAESLGVEFSAEALVHLLRSHYEKKNRPKRFCHPRDLLSQIKSYCNFIEQSPIMTREAVDAAIENYFVD